VQESTSPIGGLVGNQLRKKRLTFKQVRAIKRALKRLKDSKSS